MLRGLVAVIDYRSSRELSDIKRTLERADRSGRVVPADWTKKKTSFRSLTVYADGRLVFQGASAASLVRRMRKSNGITGTKQGRNEDGR